MREILVLEVVFTAVREKTGVKSQFLLIFEKNWDLTLLNGETLLKGGSIQFILPGPGHRLHMERQYVC